MESFSVRTVAPDILLFRQPRRGAMNMQRRSQRWRVESIVATLVLHQNPCKRPCSPARYDNRASCAIASLCRALATRLIAKRSAGALTDVALRLRDAAWRPGRGRRRWHVLERGERYRATSPSARGRRPHLPIGPPTADALLRAQASPECRDRQRGLTDGVEGPIAWPWAPTCPHGAAAPAVVGGSLGPPPRPWSLWWSSSVGMYSAGPARWGGPAPERLYGEEWIPA
jgi:hypothetical protein